jgi:protein-disulfide isomerase
MRVAAPTAMVLAAGLLALAACDKKAATNFDQDMTMGSAKAPVTMIEYASVTCPHCAAWNAEVFPSFKKKYIDTGKVHYVFREALIHPELDMMGYRLARCEGPDKYFQVVDAIMRSQADIFADQGAHARDAFLTVAKSTGMNEKAFDACLSDDEEIKKQYARIEAEAKEYNIDHTPTFIIGGKEVGGGEASLEVLSATIDPLLKGGAAPAGPASAPAKP